MDLWTIRLRRTGALAVEKSSDFPTARPFAHKLHSARANLNKIRESQNQTPATGFSLFRPGSCPNHRSHRSYTGIENPFKIARKPAVDDARDRRISPEELEAICQATHSAELASFVRLAVETAARRGELLALEWKDVDLRKRVATLRQTKNGSDRCIPLSGKAVELLQDLPRNLNGTVFTLKPDNATQGFQRAVKRARAAYKGDDPTFLVDVRLHDARHEGVSRLAERGWSTLEISSVSGHKTLQLLNRYVHMRAEDLAVKLAAVG